MKKSGVASIEILRSAWVAPLTQIEHPEGPWEGCHDGGVYNAHGEISTRGLHVKQGYINRPKSLIIEGYPSEHMEGNYIFGGMIQSEHFGHFMVESINRLWSVNYISNKFEKFAFYKRSLHAPICRYVGEFFNIIIPDFDLKIISSNTQFDILAVPCQIQANGWLYGHDVIRECFSPLRKIRAPGHKRIYVSRAGLSPRDGGLLLESMIEQALEAEGYGIIRPETMSLRQQIEAYNEADDLIFAEGSSLHIYALVAQPLQRVFVIWRRRLQPGFGWQISTFGGPTVRGMPCIYRFWVPDGAEVRGRAELDFVLLRDQLRLAGMIRGTNWPVPAEADFMAELENLSCAARTIFVPREAPAD